MKNKEKLYLYISYIILSIILISGVVLITSYSVGIYDYDESDFLEDVLWARATLQSGKILSPNIYYCYVLPFGANLIMAPFVKLFGQGLLANQLGMLSFYLLYLIAIFYLGKTLFNEKEKINIFVSVSSLFIFTYAGDNVLHHILCYGIGYVCNLFIMASCINIYKNKSINKNYIILIFFSLWSSVNGASTIALSIIPTFFALIVLYSKQRDKKFIRMIIFLIVISIVGIIVNNKVSKMAINNLNLDKTRFNIAEIKQIIKNIIKLPYYWIQIFLQLFSRESIDIFSINNIKGLFTVEHLNIYTLSSIIFFVISSIMIFVSIKQLVFRKDFSCAFILLNSLCILLIDAAMCIFSTETCLRFMFNIVLQSFVISGLYFSDNNKYDVKIAIIIISMLILMLLKQYKIRKINEITKNNHIEIIDVLDENDLSYGYAKNVYGTTLNVLSNNRINFNNYDSYTKNQGFKISKIMNFGYSYENIPKNCNKFFIIMTKDDFNEFIVSELYKLNKQTLNVNNVVITIFDMNDFVKIKKLSYLD